MGAALIALLLWRTDPTRVWATIRSAQPALLALAVLLNVPLVLLRTLRAQSVLGALEHGIPFRRMLLIQLVGQTLSSMTPAASGDLVRAYFWSRGDEVPASRGVAAVAFERIGSFVLLTSVGFALALTLMLGTAGLVLGGFAIALVLALPAIASRIPERWERRLLHGAARLPAIGRFAGTLEAALGAIRELLRERRFLALFAAITFALFAINGAQLWLLLIAIGAPVPIWTAVGVFALAQTGGTLSTLPFGLGSMEVLTTGLLVRTGVAVTRAAPAALLLRAVTTLPLAIAAIVAYFPLMERRRTAGLETGPRRELA